MIKYGTTRFVILIGNYAIKFPRFNIWKCFLKGLIGNLDEKLWWFSSPKEWQEKLCPVVGCYFGGLVLVCRRAQPIDLEDYEELDFESFKPLPMDKKMLNFGFYDGRIVLVDYADSKYFCSDCENIFKVKNKFHDKIR